MTKPSSPFRYFNSSPQVIRLVVMMYVKFPLSLRNVEDLLAERGIDLSYETVRYWWNRLRPDGRRRNLFNQERHLLDRQIYKRTRSEALSEWQSVLG